MLQLTYALNYRMGGYETPWWHFTQLVLHVIVTLGLYLLCLRVLTLCGDETTSREDLPPPVDARSAARSLITIPFVAAAIFAVHPASSGVINYLNARSSLLTAAFLLPALLAYMRSADTDR